MWSKNHIHTLLSCTEVKRHPRYQQSAPWWPMRGHQGERRHARHFPATAHQSHSFHSFSAVYVPHSQHMLPLHICCNAAYLTGGHTEVKSQTITSRQSLRTYHLSEAALCVCFLNVHASLYAVQIGCTALFIKKKPMWFFLIDTMQKSSMEYILMPGNITPVEGQTSHRC